MTSVLSIETSAVNPRPYGNIRRINTAQGGRVVYQVIDSKGNETNKLSVPLEETDVFEAAYQDIMDSAPEIQNYVAEHSSEQDKRNRKALSQIIIATGGILGAAVPIVFVKTHSMAKKVISTVAGIIAGISVGYAASIALTTPPGTFKFAKATHTFSRLDIKPLEE